MCIAGHWQKAKEGYIFSRRTWNLEGRGRDTDRKCVWRGREKWPCFYAERYIVNWRYLQYILVIWLYVTMIASLIVSYLVHTDCNKSFARDI